MRYEQLMDVKIQNMRKSSLERLRTERPRARTYEEYVSGVWLDSSEGDRPATRELFEASERYDIAWRVARMTRDAARDNPHLDALDEECRVANNEERAAFRALRRLIPDAKPIQGGLE